MNVHNRIDAEAAKIMVVDDDPASLKLVMDILVSNGYQVRPATSSGLALRSAAVEVPDLILLDIKIPDMDGYTLCRRFKASEQLAKVPVIFISAHSDTAEKIEGFAAGGVDFISKPFEALEILARVATHLKLYKMQADLEKARRNAEKANQAKSEFLARMSHEIRTPLNVVIGLTHLVLKSELTAEQRDYLNKVQIGANNLLEVINDILDFSKVEAGRLELVCAPFDLDLVLEQLVDLFSNRTAQKDLELIFTVAPDVPRQLDGDAGRLTQILTNLIENAVKFTETGEIVVAVEVDDATDRRAGQAILRFRVSDTGIGIAADALPTLFEPFSQVGAYLNRKHEGSGLGLAICRRLVELMEGRLWVESRPGEGSTFHFIIELEVLKTEKDPLRLPADLEGLKALVVDDNPTSLQVLCDLLESFNVKAQAVDSGKKALEEMGQAATDAPYQLVLLDWKMPGLDGIETARLIRASKFDVQGSRLKVQDETAGISNQTISHKPKTTIIILVTAYGHELMGARIDTTAVDTILLKPVKPSRLFNTVMALFSRTEDAATKSRTEKAVPEVRLDGRRVLLVEDNELNQVLAVSLLEGMGLMVEIAENGLVAVDKATASQGGFYDAVLMDIQMPIVDGYEATKRIRAFEKQQPAIPQQPDTIKPEPGTQIPIIALTAHALKGEREKCLTVGMNDYIAKPIHEQELKRVLLRWIAPGAEEVGTSNRLAPQRPLDARTALDVQGALNRMAGRRSLYIKVATNFGSKFGQASEMIRGSLAAGDNNTAERTAHDVKSVAATIGATVLSEVAATLEKSLACQASDLEQKLTCFEIELHRVLESVRKFLRHEEIGRKSRGSSG
jgi:CheY-like chemotaxis protein/anti-sigma regulatory factor (Ser/Thr protein kinase)